MILLLCMQPWFSCDSKPIKMTWKSFFWIHSLKYLSPHWNYQTWDIFSPFLLVLNHICQSRIKVACKVAKSFLTLFPVTLVKVEVQESSLHQMNHKKVYFLTCFMQNVQKLNMVGYRALNDRADHYGPPCIGVAWNEMKSGYEEIRNRGAVSAGAFAPAVFGNSLLETKKMEVLHK